MKKHITSRALNIILIFNIIVVILMLIGTPLITTAFFKSALGILDQSLVYKVSFCIYLCSIPYLIAIFNLKKLCTLVTNETPFSSVSVRTFKTIALCAFVEIIVVIFTSLFLKSSTELFTDFTMIALIGFVTVICIPISLLCLIFSELFFNAKIIKEENDQTI